jgi:hypothetical protein
MVYYNHCQQHLQQYTMQITRYRIPGMPATVLILLWALLWVLTCGDLATAESYTGSAHGKKANRSGTGYPQGGCAHCHDPNGPDPCGNPFMLFAPSNPPNQDNNVCFQCHQGSGSVQEGGITNYDYSRTFGGATAGPTSILKAFQKLSYHDLNDVLNTAKENWPSTFNGDSNPCSACHNVHIAKRNKQQPGNPTKTALSLPSAHNELWGDGDDGDGNSERMSDYTPYYQPPYSLFDYYREPDGYGTEPENGWGSNMPDYVTFCLECHANAVTSQTLGRDLRPIDWITADGELGGDKHGWNVATLNYKWNRRHPYGTPWTQENGLVLSCTDCHEPHGSKNLMLLRRRVNGQDLNSAIDSFETSALRDLCLKCHGDGIHEIHHDNSDTLAPYFRPTGNCNQLDCHIETTYFIPCTNCHFHDGNDSWLRDNPDIPNGDEYYTGRHTF